MNIERENELRDQFAAAALQGYIAGNDKAYNYSSLGILNYKECAKGAYKMAEAMLEERKNWITSDCAIDGILDNM